MILKKIMNGGEEKEENKEKMTIMKKKEFNNTSFDGQNDCKHSGVVNIGFGSLVSK